MWTRSPIGCARATRTLIYTMPRYSYTPYGEATVLDDNFAVDSDGISNVGNEILYTGRSVDPVTGLQLNRSRWYH